MDTNKLKHVAVIEAETKAELLKKLNDAVDENGLDVIHYNIEEVTEMIDGFPEQVYAMEIFFVGPMVFDYNFSGVDKLLANWNISKNSIDR